MAEEQPGTLTGTSLDIATENRFKLKQLFPTVFTETKNDKGELVESVDFEKLKAEMGLFTDLFESRRERYGMDWSGKKEALRLIQTPSSATLKPCREESVNFDTTENLFIEGDNLEVLKLLQKSYYGKVKMIYIDPPYNTGKEFIYPDNYSESLETYLEYAGLIDGEGKKFSTNTANEGRFHTKWLNMMYPRLYLARNLLRDDGVIFISIDDNEVSNLRKMCDDIFGEENSICTFIWKRRQNVDSRSKNGASLDHEYVLSYGKQTNAKLKGGEKDLAKYSNPDNDPKGDWMSADMTGLATKDQRPNLHYDLIHPITNINYGCPTTGWRYEPKRMKQLIENDEVLFPKNPEGRPRRKKFLADLQSEFTGKSSIFKTVFNTHATRELRDLFSGIDYFDFPKPVNFIKEVLTQSSIIPHGSYAELDIILDFFSGSSTTAHAVLDLNKQDNGNRKFILVQLPEPCSPDSEAFKAGYKTIADIGKERIRRVIKKLNQEEEGKLDFGESNTQDRGFKVLKLDKSNFKQWQKLDPSTPVAEIEEELFKHIDHISPKATPEDLLYEILLKAGFTPTEKIETKTLADQNVFSIAEGALLLCLENTITKELIDAVAESEPMQFICLDSAFHGNDQLKANAVQTFAARNMQREKHNQIVFKTV
ncbi:MAG: site-specific DNA-methyltransferase [Desulfamplus sp.]|nr:site-specific DNA-methyltransferase [Desulfamplus sp.]